MTAIESVTHGPPVAYHLLLLLSRLGATKSYKAIDGNKLLNAPPETVQTINGVQNDAKKNALRTVAIFPVIMLIFYLGLIFYFKAKKGGYKPVELAKNESLPMAEF